MLKALVTTLALVAGSAAAVADTPRYDNTHQQDTRRDDMHRGDMHRKDKHQAVLARGMSVGVAGQPRFIPIAKNRLDADRVQLKLRRGNAFVQRVTLVYDNGRRETLRVDQPLNKDSRTITLNVDSGLRGLTIDTRQQPYARGGGSRRAKPAIVDVIGIRK